MKRTAIISGIILVLIVSSAIAQTTTYQKIKFPEYYGYVNDFEKIFSDNQIDELDSIIGNHEKETTNQIAVATITSYKPYNSLFEYSLGLANYWGPGQKEKNNGVLIVFGKKIREIRIQIGTGLEEKLTNEETQAIIDTIIIPKFKQDNYFDGIKDGINAIISEIK